MVALILGLFLLAVGLGLIIIGIGVISGKLFKNPLVTFILGIFAGRATKKGWWKIRGNL